MNNTEPKIVFYNLDGKKIDIYNIEKGGKLDTSKQVKVSKNFNKALKQVIKKDINFLSNKVKNVVKDITKRLAMNGTILDVKLSSDVENIDTTINDVETLISDLIIKKDSIKVGLFSSNKKDKKDKIKKLENSINYLSKVQNDIISIKNEYTKLVQRNVDLEGLEFEKEEEKQIDCDSDPLERTINFYMTQAERN